MNQPRRQPWSNGRQIIALLGLMFLHANQAGPIGAQVAAPSPVASPSPSGTKSPPASPAPSPEFQAWIQERDRLVQRVNAAIQARNAEEAFVAARVLAKADNRRFSEISTDAAATANEKVAVREAFAQSLGTVAGLLEGSNSFHDAEGIREMVVQLFEKELGAKNWRSIDARHAMAKATMMKSWTREQLERWTKAQLDNEKMLQLNQAGNYAEAATLGQSIVETLKALAGKEHLDVGLALRNVSVIFRAAGDLKQAAANCERCLSIFKNALGEGHPRYAETLGLMADIHRSGGRYDEALKLYRQALPILEVALGRESREYSTMLGNLGIVYQTTAQWAEAEECLKQVLSNDLRNGGERSAGYATALGNLASMYSSLGRHHEAALLFEKGLKIKVSALGPSHPECTTLLNNLGREKMQLGRYLEAKDYYLKTLDILEKTVGNQHPNYAIALVNLGQLHSTLGDLPRAIDDYARALEITSETLGANHPQCAVIYNNLGVNYLRAEDYAKAEAAYTKAAEILKASLGTAHPNNVMTLNNLAQLRLATGDHEKAAEIQLEAIKVAGAAYGNEHPQYALCLHNCAELVRREGNLEEAIGHFREAAEIRKKTLGPRHPLVAASLHGMGMAALELGRFEEAKPLLAECLDIEKAAYGERHPQFLITSQGIAFAQYSLGKFDEAEKEYKRLLSLFVEVEGERHSHTVICMISLAQVLRSQGKYAEAAPLYRRALSSSRASLESTAVIQSERQQLAMGQALRPILDGYISLGLESPGLAEPVFREALLWKGATLVRQRNMRLAADDPAVADLFRKLQETARHLTALTRAVPDKAELRADWTARIAALTEEKERLEADLSVRSAAYRAATQAVTPEDLLAALPKDAALVDYLEFTRMTPVQGKERPATLERQLVAFVVRPAAKPEDRVKMFALGPAIPIGRAIDTWLGSLGIAPAAVGAGRELRKTIWEPLLPALADAKTILASTDGVLGRLPLVALPGKLPDTYLLEDHRLAMIPVPQLLPTLVGRETKDEAQKELLLVGDVDYDSTGSAAPAAPPKKKSPRRPGDRNRAPGSDAIFNELEYTKAEVEGLRELYGELFDITADDPYPLTRGTATEAEFRKLAPRYRHLHLATHGFFAGPEYAAARNEKSTEGVRGHATLIDRDAPLIGYNPGLLSGLALAGANLEPRDDADDGILTSQEIAFLPLQGVDLIVLSACETGLGDVAGGEGLLGVQRAFQVAGAGTTVAGLWKVDDLQTMALMKRFYRNLWKDEMSRLDALREAQLWMLKEGPRRDTRINVPAGQESPEPKRSPPYYWAPFVLSGDWR